MDIKRIAWIGAQAVVAALAGIAAAAILGGLWQWAHQI